MHELERRTIVTRLGEGVDAAGRLGEDAMERVFEACARVPESDRRSRRGACRSRCSPAPCATPPTAPSSSASSRGDSASRPRRSRASARRASPTWARRAARHPAGPMLVLDIGGGSTEVVVGQGTSVGFFVSTQLGSVRYTERHIHSDPPAPAELEACRAAARAELESAVPRDGARAGERGHRRGRARRPRSRRSSWGSTPTTPTGSRAIASRSPPASGSSRSWPPCPSPSARLVTGPAPRPRAHDRRRRDDPGRGDGAVRPRRDRGLGARHPPRRSTRGREKLLKAAHFATFWADGMD